MGDDVAVLIKLSVGHLVDLMTRQQGEMASSRRRSTSHQSISQLLQCCVSPQSEIARIRIDRSMIGQPTNFRHLGHMGADDTTNSGCSVEAVSRLLSSKGESYCAIPVPKDLRRNDIPIRGQWSSNPRIYPSPLYRVMMWFSLFRLLSMVLASHPIRSPRRLLSMVLVSHPIRSPWRLLSTVLVSHPIRSPRRLLSMVLVSHPIRSPFIL